ncbi:MAG: metallophosphoesterase [Pseudomonadota bacterium]
MSNEILQRFSIPDHYFWDEWTQDLESQLETGVAPDFSENPFISPLSAPLSPSPTNMALLASPEGTYDLSRLLGDPEELDFNEFSRHLEQRTTEIDHIIELVDNADFLSETSLNYFSERLTNLEDSWRNLSEQALDPQLEPQRRVEVLNQIDQINNEIDIIAGFYIQANRVNEAVASENFTDAQRTVVTQELEFAASQLRRSLETENADQARHFQDTAERVVAGIQQYTLIASQLDNYIGVTVADRNSLWRSYQNQRSAIRTHPSLDNLQASLSQNLETITSRCVNRQIAQNADELLSNPRTVLRLMDFNIQRSTWQNSFDNLHRILNQEGEISSADVATLRESLADLRDELVILRADNLLEQYELAPQNSNNNAIIENIARIFADLNFARSEVAHGRRLGNSELDRLEQATLPLAGAALQLIRFNNEEFLSEAQGQERASLEQSFAVLASAIESQEIDINTLMALNYANETIQRIGSRLEAPSFRSVLSSIEGDLQSFDSLSRTFDARLGEALTNLDSGLPMTFGRARMFAGMNGPRGGEGFRTILNHQGDTTLLTLINNPETLVGLRETNPQAYARYTEALQRMGARMVNLEGCETPADIRRCVQVISLLERIDELPESLRRVEDRQAFLTRIQNHHSLSEIQLNTQVGYYTRIAAMTVAITVASGAIAHIASAAVLSLVGSAFASTATGTAVGLGGRAALGSFTRFIIGNAIMAPTFVASHRGLSMATDMPGADRFYTWDEFVVHSVYAFGMFGVLRGAMLGFGQVARMAMGTAATTTRFGAAALWTGAFATETVALTGYGLAEQSFENYIHDRPVSGVWTGRNIAGQLGHNALFLVGLRGGNMLARPIISASTSAMMPRSIRTLRANNSLRLEEIGIELRTLRGETRSRSLSEVEAARFNELNVERVRLEGELLEADRRLVSMGLVSDAQYNLSRLRYSQLRDYNIANRLAHLDGIRQSRQLNVDEYLEFTQLCREQVVLAREHVGLLRDAGASRAAIREAQAVEQEIFENRYTPTIEGLRLSIMRRVSRIVEIEETDVLTINEQGEAVPTRRAQQEAELEGLRREVSELRRVFDEALEREHISQETYEAGVGRLETITTRMAALLRGELTVEGLRRASEARPEEPDMLLSGAQSPSLWTRLTTGASEFFGNITSPQTTFGRLIRAPLFLMMGSMGDPGGSGRSGNTESPQLAELRAVVAGQRTPVEDASSPVRRPAISAEVANQIGNHHAAGQPSAIAQLHLRPGERVVLIGDIHGNHPNFRSILRRYQDQAGVRLVSLGDVPHPAWGNLSEVDPSVDAMDLIIQARAEDPNRLIFLQGNHDEVSGGAEETFIKDGVRQGVVFRDALIAQRGEAYVRALQELYETSPLLLTVHNARGEGIAWAGHSPVVPGGAPQAHLTGARYTAGDPRYLFNMNLGGVLRWASPRGYERQEGLPVYEETDLGLMRQALGLRNDALGVGGHTPGRGETSVYAPFGPDANHFNCMGCLPDQLQVVEVYEDGHYVIVDIPILAFAQQTVQPPATPPAPPPPPALQPAAPDFDPFLQPYWMQPLQPTPAPTIGDRITAGARRVLGWFGFREAEPRTVAEIEAELASAQRELDGAREAFDENREDRDRQGELTRCTTRVIDLNNELARAQARQAASLAPAPEPAPAAPVQPVAPRLEIPPGIEASLPAIHLSLKRALQRNAAQFVHQDLRTEIEALAPNAETTVSLQTFISPASFSLYPALQPRVRGDIPVSLEMQLVRDPQDSSILGILITGIRISYPANTPLDARISTMLGRTAGQHNIAEARRLRALEEYEGRQGRHIIGSQLAHALNNTIARGPGLRVIPTPVRPTPVPIQPPAPPPSPPAASPEPEIPIAIQPVAEPFIQIPEQPGRGCPGPVSTPDSSDRGLDVSLEFAHHRILTILQQARTPTTIIRIVLDREDYRVSRVVEGNGELPIPPDSILVTATMDRHYFIHAAQIEAPNRSENILRRAIHLHNRAVAEAVRERENRAIERGTDRPIDEDHARELNQLLVNGPEIDITWREVPAVEEAPEPTVVVEPPAPFIQIPLNPEAVLPEAVLHANGFDRAEQILFVPRSDRVTDPSLVESKTVVAPEPEQPRDSAVELDLDDPNVEIIADDAADPFGGTVSQEPPESSRDSTIPLRDSDLELVEDPTVPARPNPLATPPLPPTTPPLSGPSPVVSPQLAPLVPPAPASTGIGTFIRGLLRYLNQPNGPTWTSPYRPLGDFLADEQPPTPPAPPSTPTHTEEGFFQGLWNYLNQPDVPYRPLRDFLRPEGAASSDSNPGLVVMPNPQASPRRSPLQPAIDAGNIENMIAEFSARTHPDPGGGIRTFTRPLVTSEVAEAIAQPGLEIRINEVGALLELDISDGEQVAFISGGLTNEASFRAVMEYYGDHLREGNVRLVFMCDEVNEAATTEMLQETMRRIMELRGEYSRSAELAFFLQPNRPSREFNNPYANALEAFSQNSPVYAMVRKSETRERIAMAAGSPLTPGGASEAELIAARRVSLESSPRPSVSDVHMMRNRLGLPADAPVIGMNGETSQPFGQNEPYFSLPARPPEGAVAIVEVNADGSHEAFSLTSVE